MSDRRYTKSSRSGGSGGNCVEWAAERDGVWVRDSKNPDGTELFLTFTEWQQFVHAAASASQHTWIRVTAGGAIVDKNGQQLSFTAAEWEAFTAAARDGECLGVTV